VLHVGGGVGGGARGGGGAAHGLRGGGLGDIGFRV
jgi:hypothetical protein